LYRRPNCWLGRWVCSQYPRRYFGPHASHLGPSQATAKTQEENSLDMFVWHRDSVGFPLLVLLTSKTITILTTEMTGHVEPPRSEWCTLIMSFVCKKILLVSSPTDLSLTITRNGLHFALQGFLATFSSTRLPRSLWVSCVHASQQSGP